MTDEPVHEPIEEPIEAPIEAPEVRERRAISKAWLVPLIAAAVAIWLLVTSYLERGVSIEVTFESANGVVAGETVIKYKDITVGEVEDVDLSDDLSKVVVTARVNRSIAGHLGADSRFWVVKPRIGFGGISGLETLLSGAYIELAPAPGPTADEFIGLDHPPTTAADAAGLRLVLKAISLGSVSVGSPVIHRDIAVGQVEGYRLRPDHVEVEVFVRAEYAKLVRSESKFWQSSGLEVSMGADGFRVSTASLDTLLRGGIAFETRAGSEAGEPVESGAEFQLYSRYTDIGAEYVGRTHEVIMYFENSVRGLSVGAPVEFRGIRVGEVTAVQLQYHLEKTWLQIPVRARLEPGRMRSVAGPPQPFFETLEIMVKRGLRARVATGSLITGAMFVDLDFDGDAPLDRRGNDGDPYEIPTVESGTDELLDNVSKLVAKLEKMPVEGLLREGRATLVQARETIAELDGELRGLVSNLTSASKAASTALTAVAGAMPSGTQLQADLRQLTRELTGAARSIKKLADLLAREPEALIRGRR